MKFNVDQYAVPKEVFLSYVAWDLVDRFKPVANQLDIPDDIQNFIDKNDPSLWETWHDEAFKTLFDASDQVVEKWIGVLGSPFTFLRANLRSELKKRKEQKTDKTLR